ncbi:MAG: DUF4142 domain-containing protein [Candidatus Eremiobacterota bacterium]
MALRAFAPWYGFRFNRAGMQAQNPTFNPFRFTGGNYPSAVGSAPGFGFGGPNPLQDGLRMRIQEMVRSLTVAHQQLMQGYRGIAGRGMADPARYAGDTSRTAVGQPVDVPAPAPANKPPAAPTPAVAEAPVGKNQAPAPAPANEPPAAPTPAVAEAPAGKNQAPAPAPAPSPPAPPTPAVAEAPAGKNQAPAPSPPAPPTPVTPGPQPQTPLAGQASASDAAWLQKVGGNNLTEVELGKLAVERGSTDSARAFGLHMVQDHGKALQDTKKLAGTEGVTLPGKMNPDQQAQYAKLAGLSGQAFDSAYADEMISAHHKSVASYNSELQNSTDPDFRAFATAKLAKAADHLSDAYAMKGTPAADGSMPPLSDAERAWLQKVGGNNLTEVELGALAIERGNSPEVVAFGQHMVADHGKGLQDTRVLAEKYGVALPDEMNPEQQAQYDKLAALNGAEFDKAYSAAMEAAHYKSVDSYNNQAQSATNPDVQQFALKKLPKSIEHLGDAIQLNTPAAAPATPNQQAGAAVVQQTSSVSEPAERH